MKILYQRQFYIKLQLVNKTVNMTIVSVIFFLGEKKKGVTFQEIFVSLLRNFSL